MDSRSTEWWIFSRFFFFSGIVVILNFLILEMASRCAGLYIYIYISFWKKYTCIYVLVCVSSYHRAEGWAVFFFFFKHGQAFLRALRPYKHKSTAQDSSVHCVLIWFSHFVTSVFQPTAAVTQLNLIYMLFFCMTLYVSLWRCMNGYYTLTTVVHYIWHAYM